MWIGRCVDRSDLDGHGLAWIGTGGLRLILANLYLHCFGSKDTQNAVQIYSHDKKMRPAILAKLGWMEDNGVYNGHDRPCCTHTQCPTFEKPIIPHLDPIN